MITDDLKYGYRQLIKAPGFAITAILTWVSRSARTPPSSPWWMRRC